MTGAESAIHSTSLTVDRALEIFVADGALDATHALLSVSVEVLGVRAWVSASADTKRLWSS